MAKIASTADAVMVILAAGLSTRMGAHSKLDRIFPDGSTLVRRQIRIAETVGLPVLTVGRPGDGADVVNPYPDRGISESLRRGLLAVRAKFGSAAVGILLADQPFVTAADVQSVLRRFLSRPPIVHAVRPLYHGEPGHPVFFDAAWDPVVLGLSGDQGISRIWRSRADTTELDIPVTGRPDPLFDIDTEDAYRQAALWLSEEESGGS
jgi:molybdenum cofactor cytidylyltransferase